MPLVLRVDVDKPYGRACLREKILSKASEYELFPRLTSLGYLGHLRTFLSFLEEEGIRANIYYRSCTLPPRKWLKEPLFADHMTGFHAENTADFETFNNELVKAQSHFRAGQVTSFTKHGSGRWKSGRRHYPLYEPQKYLEWADKVGIPFLFGNEEMNDAGQGNGGTEYFPRMFWIDRLHLGQGKFGLSQVLDAAKKGNVIVIIHPCNFVADKKVEQNMRALVALAREEDVRWITL
jgi:hypothetical protein